MSENRILFVNGQVFDGTGAPTVPADLGFAVAAIDYRLSGEARFPAPLEDVRTAIGWVRDHAASYALDAGRVFLWGDSAGGHLALLAALTGSTVQGVVAWFPVTDLAGLPADVADAGGVPDPGPQSRDAQLLGGPASSVPDLARQASPVSHASAVVPGVLRESGLGRPVEGVRGARGIRRAAGRDANG